MERPRTPPWCAPPTSCTTTPRLSDATWATLNEHLSTEQVLDVVFAVGQYNLVSMVLNTTGVQLDEGIPAAL